MLACVLVNSFVYLIISVFVHKHRRVLYRSSTNDSCTCAFTRTWFPFTGMAQTYVDGKVQNNKVMVFSKSYCPYCKMAKDALNSTGVKYELVELDERGVRRLIIILYGTRGITSRCYVCTFICDGDDVIFISNARGVY